jgi:WS/DGAT/MGAT family acyltransferase
MRMLSALDASFIYLESDHSPMHIGGVYLIDGKSAPASFGYETFFSHIEQRLRFSRVFRQRLVEVPLSLSHPYWINDPDFELSRHLPRLQLPAPGGRKELMQLAAQIFGRTLDRKRPLWKMSFIEGLDSFQDLARGSFAVVTKVHHAAVDGASGVELMGALMDFGAAPRKIGGKDNWRPERAPGTVRMLAAAYGKLGRKSVELGKLVGEVSAGAWRVYGASRVKRVNPPPSLLSAPVSILNRPVSSSRTYWGIDFDFERIRQIRRRLDGPTVNDVVLAICAQGLRAYLHERDALPEEPLVAMSPVSVRRDEQKKEMGNQLSAMLVSLATDIADPLHCVLQISRNTQESKVFASALPANKIAEFIPSETLAAAARLYTRTRLGGRHRPFFNLIITNVPGPKVPVYLAGARIEQQFGMAPIIDGLGLIIVVLSYAGRISLGLTSCYRVMPDPDHFAELLKLALGELEASIASAGLQRIRQQTASKDAGTGAYDQPLQGLRRAISELDRAIESLRKKTET